jgi:thiamine-monophosphate kinase
MDKFPSNEYELIRRIQKQLPPAGRTPYETMIGDDAAVRVSGAAGERLVFTADISVENVHFSLDTMTFEEVGYKAMASNLSDCAAMGAAPDGAVVQIVFPIRYKYGSHEDAGDSIEAIYKGFARACGRWNFPIVGGDISGGNVWTVGITLIGSIPANGRAVKRTGIIDGDALWVTGTPGLSAAGLAALRHFGRDGVPERYMRLVDAHISPVPRVDEGKAFASAVSAHSMMDLSDGLSKDIGTLCYDNDLGFVFDKDIERMQSQSMQEMIRLADELGCDWRDWFYHGGEEYELLVACAPSFNLRDVAGSCQAVRLGYFTSKLSGVNIRREDGGAEGLPLKGWDHFRP